MSDARRRRRRMTSSASLTLRIILCFRHQDVGKGKCWQKNNSSTTIKGAKGEHANGSFHKKDHKAEFQEKQYQSRSAPKILVATHESLWPGFIGDNSTGREEEF
ncbi:hypothetical protein RUM43_010135 [Polyplax serrata]|uniref:Uncharacterized protein n=1 Tax=Polyplax serrata TaxID=468196 RepID=A0AAN8S4P5_POLSC